MHSLEMEQGWRDYAKGTPDSANLAEAFICGWASLGRYHPEYDHHDRLRFLAIFMDTIKKDRASRQVL